MFRPIKFLFVMAMTAITVTLYGNNSDCPVFNTSDDSDTLMIDDHVVTVDRTPWREILNILINKGTNIITGSGLSLLGFEEVCKISEENLSDVIKILIDSEEIFPKYDADNRLSGAMSKEDITGPAENENIEFDFNKRNDFIRQNVTPGMSLIKLQWRNNENLYNSYCVVSDSLGIIYDDFITNSIMFESNAYNTYLDYDDDYISMNESSSVPTIHIVPIDGDSTYIVILSDSPAVAGVDIVHDSGRKIEYVGASPVFADATIAGDNRDSTRDMTMRVLEMHSPPIIEDKAAKSEDPNYTGIKKWSLFVTANWLWGTERGRVEITHICHFTNGKIVGQDSEAFAYMTMGNAAAERTEVAFNKISYGYGLSTPLVEITITYDNEVYSVSFSSDFNSNIGGTGTHTHF